MLERVGKFLVTHRYWVICAHLLITVVLGSYALGIRVENTPEEVLKTDDPELTALRAYERTFGSFDHFLFVGLSYEDIFSREALRELGEIHARVAALNGVDQVLSLADCAFPLPDPNKDREAFKQAVLDNRLLEGVVASTDGRSACMVVGLDPIKDRGEERIRLVESVRVILEEVRPDYYLTGFPFFRAVYIQGVWSNIRLLFPLVGLALMVLSYLYLRSFRAVISLLGTVAVSAVWMLGGLALLEKPLTMLSSVLPALLMVVGVATGIHVMAQYREERAQRAGGAQEAARRTFRAMFHPCGLTSFTTMVGFCCVAFTSILQVREFGLAAAASVGIVFVVTITALPALLATGRFDPNSAGRLDFLGSVLHYVSHAAVRRPRVTLAATVVMMAAAAAAASRVEVNSYLLEDVDPDHLIYRSTRFIEERFNGIMSFDVVLEAKEGLITEEGLDWIRELQRFIEGLPDVTRTYSVLDLVEAVSPIVPSPMVVQLILHAVDNSEGRAMLSSMLTSDRTLTRIVVRTTDAGSRSALARYEAVDAYHQANAPEGIQGTVCGISVLANRVLTDLVSQMVWGFLLALLMICVTLMCCLGGWVVGFVAMVPSLLPLLAAAGVMALLDIHLRSSVAIIYTIALGISVDDTIHLLVRTRRERQAGWPPVRALERSIATAGRPIVITSLLLFVGFCLFMTAPMQATVDFGLLAAVTIAVALYGDLLVLPSLAVIRPRLLKRLGK